jgi:transposase-like protein
VGRPPRPSTCVSCNGGRIWFDGWRVVHTIVLDDGQRHRFEQGLPLQRVVCASCDQSWVLRPAWLYPHRSFEPDVAEAAALAYLTEPAATYAAVAKAFGCATSTAWRWVSWVAGLGEPATVVAATARIDPATPAADLVPREVPQDHPKARSEARSRVLLRALQLLVALAAFARVQVHPPDDPSALRFWLLARFRASGEIALLTRPGFSPRLENPVRGPPM